MKNVNDMDYLERMYFYFDIPVKFQLKDNQQIEITPISLRYSEIFLSSIDILTIDKNSLPNPKIIQMSYLQFICDILISNDELLQKFVTILKLSLNIDKPIIMRDKMNRPYIFEKEKNLIINHRDFEQLKKIILYQNLLHYDDSYINPDFKKAISEVEELKQKQFEQPSLERKIAIITAHTGISKKEQLEMTLRSHSLLFEEVCQEVDFVTLRPVALFSGNAENLQHWIFKKKKNKYEDYITQVDEYAKKMGSNSNAIKSSSNNSSSENLISQFNNFK